MSSRGASDGKCHKVMHQKSNTKHNGFAPPLTLFLQSIFRLIIDENKPKRVSLVSLPSLISHQHLLLCLFRSGVKVLFRSTFRYRSMI